MFKVIGMMVLGILTGFLFRKKQIKWIQVVITILIWALLFVLGIEVGGNKTIIENLHTLGFQALIIAVAGVLGSCFLAWVLWRFVVNRKKKGVKDER